MSTPVLEIQNLTKRYGNITAINQLSLTIEKGSIHGILGPNGSGKTTTLGIVLDILQPQEGSYSWFQGVENTAARKRLGALLETPNFYPYLNADRNLAIVAKIKGVKQTRFDEILELVKLKERRNSPFRTYSLGMKQRLAIASSLIGDPEVLILDEPTNGLDPQGIAEVRETIRQIGESGKTIIMASHILNEVEKVCTEISILKKGQLKASGSVGAILDNNLEVNVGAADNNGLFAFLSAQSFVQNLRQEETHIYFEIEATTSAEQINQTAFDNGFVLNYLSVKGRSLEEEFLKITAQ